MLSERNREKKKIRDSFSYKNGYARLARVAREATTNTSLDCQKVYCVSVYVVREEIHF